MVDAKVRGATVLVTGGAGFVGAAVARRLSRPDVGARVVALDNLRRRGSELNVPLLRDAGVEFVHGDARNPEDLALGGRPIDLIVECAAEPSVLAGYGGGSRYVVDANLGGLVNCAELARERRARVLFLSTSRVYPVALVNALRVHESPTRFVLDEQPESTGASAAGISESFSLAGVRTLYGSTKLAGELLLAEYAALGVSSVTTRFGVIAGPGQMGKVDQGVFALWMARHVFGGGLCYQGWGGEGKQVRDVLHIDDVCDLLLAQLGGWTSVEGRVWNAGGGVANSLSLAEMTALCREISGAQVPMSADLATHPSDVRVYLTDQRALLQALPWRPTRSPRTVLEDLHTWMVAHAAELAPVFGA
ncbi:MAG: NAD-dependent epimerase/dehydratase family protein [Gemmatimonadetes bacterium]|nr:NAD-dependent epimerase/dehydratase family protein [Gemmatimonadota bacterium]